MAASGDGGLAASGDGGEQRWLQAAMAANGDGRRCHWLVAAVRFVFGCFGGVRFLDTVDTAVSGDRWNYLRCMFPRE